ncbi:MAG: hypothetical protein ACHQD8_03370 [Chitinophagales bacterium]
MKRILLACFLLTATCTVISIQHATAQTVTQASFLTKVNTMDTYIGAGNLAAAQTTWTDIHNDMLTVLGVTKASIHTATTPADVTYYTNILVNQRTIYAAIWQLHTDLVTNRVAIHDKLVQFDATIY